MDSTDPGRPLKKGSFIEENDRISQLPKDIIFKILSFVTPTKYAIRTSVLSKRWENLWALSPKIVLELPCIGGKEIEMSRSITFTNSVDNLFVLRDGLHIEYFKLLFIGTFSSFRMRASSWVCAAVMCSVRELDLHISSIDSDLLELPWCLFTCKTLVVLNIHGNFILNVPHRVCLPNLKTLSLGWIIYLGDKEIHKLLSGCPVLEDLKIFRDQCDQLWDINVSVSSLKRLTFVSHPDTEEFEDSVCWHKIVVDAPNIEFITLSDQFPHDIIFKALPNIVEAHIDVGVVGEICDDEGNQTRVLLQSFINVKRLFLSFGAVFMLFYETELALPRFDNLVFLELEYNDNPTHPVHLIDLLRSAPNLEVVSFPYGFKFDSDMDSDDEDVDFELNDLEEVPECLHHSLKVVQIKFSSDEMDLSLVMYLLENAMVLEKMTVSFYPGIESVELQTEISNHPRLSTDCQLVFI